PSLPPALGRGDAPSRVGELPDLATLVPLDRGPDFVETSPRAWHYGQTDANRHVNGMEYLREMEDYVAGVFHAGGHDLARLYFARARIVYRKPCFRGEGDRRLAWFRGEAPVGVAGAFAKGDDPRHARPAVGRRCCVLDDPRGEQLRHDPLAGLGAEDETVDLVG